MDGNAYFVILRVESIAKAEEARDVKVAMLGVLRSVLIGRALVVSIVRRRRGKLRDS